MTVIPHWLTKQAYLAPNQIAIETEDNNTLTFIELKEASEKFAKKLAQKGIKKGSHIGIFSSNNTSMVVTIHALSYLGAVCVLLNTRLTGTELSYQLQDAEVSIVLVSDNYKNDVENMDFPLPTYTYSEVNQWKEADVVLQTEISLADNFTIIYTSGTTGPPKGVVHTYGNHWWSAIGSTLNLGLHKNDTWLSVLPMFHVGGLSIIIRSVIYGIAVYLLDEFNEKQMNKVIMEENITIASVVTVMLQRLINTLDGKSYPASLRCILLGGGPAPKPLLEKAKALQIPVFQSYGMTETSSQIVTLSPEDALQKIGSAGKPLFPGQLKIMNQDENDIGEIFVKGPMVTKEYYNNKQATKASFEKGWLATGDAGYLDEEGFLYVVDRRNDLIISGGENIYPAEIESVLTGMKQVREVGVVGKKDNAWGQVPVAFIVTNDESLTVEKVQIYAKVHLAPYKIPKEVHFIDSLPRNAANKLVRNKLFDLLK